MNGQSTGSMKMIGNVDRDFVRMMIMHHQQAIKMVDAEIASVAKPKLKALAQKLGTAQQMEITQLRRLTK